MKHILIRIGILTAVFIVAVIGFSYLTNRENTDMTADIQSATLPVVSYISGETTINQLMGYVEEMDVPSMRDTITPVSNQKLRMMIKDYGTKVNSFTYELYTLDGKKSLMKEKVKEIGEEITLHFDGENLLGSERVLIVTLHLEEKKDVRYYTRVVDSENMNIGSCLSFVGKFFEAERDKDMFEEYKAYLEPDPAADNSTFETVTIQSDYYNVTWGDLKPQIIGEVRWCIEELNTTYASIRLDYQVICTGEQNEQERYNVKEFFRVRDGGSKMYLFDYYRTADQVFDGAQKVLSEKGILLGVVPQNVDFMTDKNGARVSFVQERELWSYNKEADELALVFSFGGVENSDARYLYDHHNITLISVEENGSTTFAVSGYMNRGIHEGSTGVAIYYFNSEKNAVEEKAFIPTDKSYAILKNDTERMVYYSNKNNLLYAMLNGTLYEVNLKDNNRKILVQNMEPGQYAASKEGHIFAYQTNGSIGEATEITVLNLENGSRYAVNAGTGECIKPLGFVHQDFIYGIARQDDIGTTISGETVIPMYKLEITNNGKELLKTYQVENTYILDVIVENGLVTLNRVSKEGTVYTGMNADYITNNTEKAKSNISLEAYSTDLKKTQMRLTYEDGISDQNVKLLQPKQIIFKASSDLALEEVETKGKYYVYALGSLKAVYNKAAYAVQKAAEISGVAVASNQGYLWEKLGREKAYLNEGIGEFSVGSGGNSLSACLSKLIEFEGGNVDITSELAEGKSPMSILNDSIGGEAIDLTGCSVDEVLYTVGLGRPVIAIIGEGQAVLLIGYDKTTVTYIDPASGSRKTVSTEKMQELVEPGGNSFIGYMKSGA